MMAVDRTCWVARYWYVLALLGILVVDATLLGASWLPLHGFADELSNLLTAFIWLTAAQRLSLPIRVYPGMIAAVVIDLDHLPVILGWFSPPEGTSRPVTHSLSLLLAFVALAVMTTWWAQVWTGVAVGVLSHLVRDLGTGTVLFWWPLSSDPVSLPYMAYFLGST